NTSDASINYSSAQRGALKPFDGMLIYQRRSSTGSFTLIGNSGAANLTGTVYMKWGQMTITGDGHYTAQFIVGNIILSGNGNVNLTYIGNNVAKVPQVFLVN